MTQIEIDLPPAPNPGGYHSSPSGDTDYEEACKKWHDQVAQIVKNNVPPGHILDSFQTHRKQIVRHYATVNLIPVTFDNVKEQIQNEFTVNEILKFFQPGELDGLFPKGWKIEDAIWQLTHDFISKDKTSLKIKA